MAATERVTVRMSRSDPNTPWGFRLHGGQEYGNPLVIGRVAQGSLSDRAGLQDGDKLLEIAGVGAVNMRHQNAQDAILRSGNTLDMVVERLASRSWKPFMPPVEFPDTTNVTTQQSVSPRPFGQPQENYSSSRRVVTESYSGAKPSQAGQYQQQPDQFGAGPRTAAVPPSKEDPKYLQSETLRMIKESESRGSSTPQPVPTAIPAPISGSAPPCDHCGRIIHGVFCKAGGKTLHGDCFKCATCGGPLKNKGYFLINGKLYCDIHARQQQENQYKANPPVDPDMFHSYASQKSQRPVEPVKGFYQPTVLKGGPASVNVPPAGSFSPQGQGSDRSYTSSQQYWKTTSTPSWDHESSVNQSQYYPSAMSPRPAYQPSRPAPPRETRWPAAAAGGGGGGGVGGGGGGISTFGPGRQPAAGAKVPKRGKGILKQLHETPRIPICESCHREIRGPFVLALNKTWCPDHFVCAIPQCGRKLLDIGFVEENGLTNCEFCYEKYLAPSCSRCSRSVVGDCLTALGRPWHPECFVCSHCHRSIGNSAFYMENGQPYCENDWSNLFTTKCASCQFAIDPGDRWVEALGSAYHAECFCCSVCQKNLEGQNFLAKGGKPYCKAHA